MATKLYVGNLPFNTTDERLREHFSQAGEVVSATVVVDKMTGRSRGFAFVEMSTEEGAKAAIEKFNGQDFDGRNLVVNEARPLEARPPRSGGFGGGRGGFGGGRGGFGGRSGGGGGGTYRSDF
ncbi:MAG: RNA-binding protein [Candidatus Yanofskybacteria bacterium]|nr:RNA-binding protein [Candidatus Yanofskybacteria bacterium]